MHIGLLKELGSKLLKYLLSGIAAAFILIVIVGITTRYYHYNDNSSALIRYGYSLYKEDLIDEINWTRVGDKFMVKNSDYADFKVGYNQSEFLDVNVNIRMYNFDDVQCTVIPSVAYGFVTGMNLQLC